MSELNDKKEITKEEFAANEIKAFCAYVMHPESDLHKDADDWIKERLQANGANASDSGLHLQRVMPMLLSIAKCFDDYLEDLDPKDDAEELSEAVEMMRNIVDDNSMFIRN